MRAAIVGLLVFLALGSPALAEGLPPGDPLPRAALPAWVEDLPLPAPTPALVDLSEDGVHYLMRDLQVRWQGDLEEASRHVAVQAIDRTGLEEAASVSIDYDPLLERVALNRLAVWRDGTMTDLTQTLPAESFRRESGLDDGVLTGRLTLYLRVPDLRVGDVVETIVTIGRTEAIPGLAPSLVQALEFIVPVETNRILVHWPAGLPMRQGAFPEGVAIETSQHPGAAGETVLEWRVPARVPPKLEPHTPYSENVFADLNLSGMQDWGRLSGALAGHYTADYPLTPDWEARIAEIRAASPDKGDQAIAALRLVQGRISYHALELGPGGYFARPPAEVITSGYGDCKDKALLLRVMLQRLGIPAAVALVNLDIGKRLPLLVPTPRAFDHAILRLELADGVHWMDPTLSHQAGDIAHAVPPDYGFALPLTGPQQTALEPIPIDPARYWNFSAERDVLFTPLGVLMNLTVVYEGANADMTRARLAESTARKFQDEDLEYENQAYPGIVVFQPMIIEDDEALNRITLKEFYLIPSAAIDENELMEDFPFGGHDFADAVPEVQVGKRRAPMAIGGPERLSLTVRVAAPPLRMIPPDPETIRNDAFDYAFTARQLGSKGVEMVWTFNTDVSEVPADRAKAVVRDGRKVAESRWLSWDLTKPDAE